MNIEEILQLAKKQNASDIHITPDSPLMHRIEGKLVPLEGSEVTEAEMNQFVEEIVPTEKKRKELEEEGELAFAFTADEGLRVRANIYCQRGTYAASLRIVKAVIPTAEELELPSALLSLMKNKKGLILVTGAAGSGKSTTLASMINAVAEKETKNIITLENPIEYMISHKKSMVAQREIGTDTKSYTAGLESALRQDADIISVGELSDAQTVETVLRAVDTGHLVCAALYTGTAETTVRHLIGLFPPHRQEQIKRQLADALLGIVSKQLLPRMDGNGRCAVYEVLLAEKEIKDLIREDRLPQLSLAMERGKERGMRRMDDAILSAYMKSRISAETAVAYAKDTENMQKMIQIY